NPKNPYTIDGIPARKLIIPPITPLSFLGQNALRQIAENTPATPPTSTAPALTQSVPTIIGSTPKRSDTSKKSLVGAQSVPKMKLNTPISDRAGTLSYKM